MDGNAAALVIGSQIDALRPDLLGNDAAKKAAASKAIRKLQAARDRITVKEGDAIGAEIDKLVEALEKIRTAQALDAVSALGRTIKKLRGMGGNGVGNG
jgi:hypothetical protein